MSEIDDRGDRMAEAYEIRNVPEVIPVGPAQVTLFEPPRGAMKVEQTRDLGTIRQQVGRLAKAMGDDFYYRWPAKNKDGTTAWIEGASVKATNAVQRIYGNCQVEVRAVDAGDSWMLYARFIDFETGFVLVRPFQQRKAQNVGKSMDAARAQDIVFQIGVSKATRNVVANALTEFVDYAFDEAKSALVGTVGKEPDKYRQRILDKLAGLNVTVDRVERIHGRSVDKWLAQDMALIIAEIQSVNDRMAHPDELWPPASLEAPRPQESDFKTGEQASSQTKPSAGAEKVEEKNNSNAGGASTSTEQPEQAKAEADPVDEEEEDDKPSAAFENAMSAVENFIKTLDDPEADIADSKKTGRTLIDSLEGVSDDERDILRGMFTTAVLTEESKRAKAKKKPRAK